MTEQPAKDILVSIAFPTRGRVKKLWGLIESAVKTVKNPDRLEFVLRLDEDDLETIDAMPGIQHAIKPTNLTAIIGAKLPGDFQEVFAEMFLQCCEQSRGKWIFQMEDDCAIMPESKGWDYELSKIQTHNTLCSPSANIWHGHRITWEGPNQCGAWHTCHFPIMPNGWWREFGLCRVEPPVDSFTLNYLTGRGYGGTPPGKGWQIRAIPGLVTWHGQVEDSVFHARNRKDFQ